MVFDLIVGQASAVEPKCLFVDAADNRLGQASKLLCQVSHLAIAGCFAGNPNRLLGSVSSGNEPLPIWLLVSSTVTSNRSPGQDTLALFC